MKYQSLNFPGTEKWNSLIKTKILMVPDYFSVSGILVTTEKKINGCEGETGKRQHYQLSPKAMIPISNIHQEH